MDPKKIVKACKKIFYFHSNYPLENQEKITEKIDKQIQK